MRIMDVEWIAAADREALADRLLPGEVLHEAFRASSGTILFTDRRIVTVQRQVLLAERTETTSFSYAALRQFSILEGAPPETRAELRIWIGSDPNPLHLRSNAGADLFRLQQLLATKLSSTPDEPLVIYGS